MLPERTTVIVEFCCISIGTEVPINNLSITDVGLNILIARVGGKFNFLPDFSSFELRIKFGLCIAQINEAQFTQHQTG